MRKDIIRAASKMVKTMKADPTLPEFFAKLEEKHKAVIEARRAATRITHQRLQSEITI